MRLRQKVSTSSSSSAPTYVSRGQGAPSKRPVPLTEKARLAAAAAASSSAAAAAGPSSAASSLKLMANLLKKSSKRSEMLSRAGQIRVGGAGEDLSASDDDDDGAPGRQSPSKGALSSAAVSAFSSSDESETSDDDGGNGSPTARGGGTAGDLGVLGDAAEGISAVLAKDRLAKAARRTAKRELRRKTWSGCWVRTKKRRAQQAAGEAEQVDFVQDPVRRP